MKTLSDYQQLAVRTSFSDDLSMPAWGIVGELGEVIEAFDEFNVKHFQEELGDMMWYIADITNKLGRDLTSFYGPGIKLETIQERETKFLPVDLSIQIKYLTGHILKFAELMKKKTFNGHREVEIVEIEDKLKWILEKTITLICATGDLRIVLENNIEKLEARHEQK